MGEYPRPMHRPTRQNRNLQAKLAAKITRSRASGKKAKRWKKWLEEYKSLNQDSAASAEASE